MPLNLPTEIFGSVIVVHTPDEMSGEQADQIGEYLCRLDRKHIVLDLDNTELIDSNGLTALITGQESVRGEGGDLKIATSNHTNRKILEITRLDQQLEVFDSVIDAVKSFA